jgi:hypothetical protein
MTERSISISSDGETALPLAEIVTGRGFLTGKSGSGKSNSMGVVIEGLLDRGIPVCILDAEGEYRGLTDQYSVLHAGAAASCDVTVNATDAARIADTVIERHVPVVLDTSEFLDDDELHELVAGVARRLFEREKTAQHPALLVVEECHEYLPQRGRDDAKDRLLQIAKRGRKRGLGICGISQRPASVSKDFITQCDWHGWHRLTYPNDLDVVKDLLTGEYAALVEDLAVGEALLWADWLAECQCVQWPRKQTLDYGGAPAIDRALDSTPEQIDADVFDSFAVDYEIDVSLPEAGCACLEHLSDVVAALDTEERYMLDYVRAHGPIDPKPAYAMAGGTKSKEAVYQKIRTLRGEQFITRTGHGTYSYVLPDRVEAHLRFMPEVEQAHISAIVTRLEANFDGIADAPPDESIAVGETLGTYRVHENGTGGGYAQPGKPVSRHLGVSSGETVAVTPQTDDGSYLVVRPGDDGELSYATFEHKDYAAFTLGARGIAAVDATPGDTLRAEAASDHTVHVAVADTAG